MAKRCFPLRLKHLPQIPIGFRQRAYLGPGQAFAVLRTPISKQCNEHIQRVLVEAAKLAPRQNHELALIHEREKQKVNRNRATLAVARKMVAYLLAVDRRERDFVPAEAHSAAVA